MACPSLARGGRGRSWVVQKSPRFVESLVINGVTPESGSVRVKGRPVNDETWLKSCRSALRLSEGDPEVPRTGIDRGLCWDQGVVKEVSFSSNPGSPRLFSSDPIFRKRTLVAGGHSVTQSDPGGPQCLRPSSFVVHARRCGRGKVGPYLGVRGCGGDARGFSFVGTRCAPT